MASTFASLIGTAKAGQVYGVDKLPKYIRRKFPKVTKLVMATENVIVPVTPSDIAKASARDPSGCAMARACNREHKIDGAAIGLSRSYLIQGDTAVRFQTPAALGREIVSIDRNGPKAFAPGNYHLAAVGRSQRPGQRDYHKKPYKQASRRGRRRRLVHGPTEGVRTFA